MTDQIKELTPKQKEIETLKEKYIEYYRELPIQKYAAMHIGRNEDTIIDWKKKDSDFSDRVQMSRAAWVKEKARKVKPEFALERIEKEIWSQRMEHTGPAGEALELEFKATQELAKAIKDAILKDQNANNTPAPDGPKPED